MDYTGKPTIDYSERQTRVTKQQQNCNGFAFKNKDEHIHFWQMMNSIFLSSEREKELNEKLIELCQK